MQILIDTTSKTLTLKGKASLDELFTFLSDKIKDWPDWSLQAEENKYSFDHLWRGDGTTINTTPYTIKSRDCITTKDLINWGTTNDTKINYRGKDALCGYETKTTLTSK